MLSGDEDKLLIPPAFISALILVSFVGPLVDLLDYMLTSRTTLRTQILWYIDNLVPALSSQLPANDQLSSAQPLALAPDLDQAAPTATH